MVTDATEKRFEADIESFFLSPAGGYTKGADTYDAKQGLYVHTLIDFVQRTQPKEWARFENANQVDPVRKFCTAFNTACETEGLLSVLRHGFKHRGLRFRGVLFQAGVCLESGGGRTVGGQHRRVLSPVVLLC